MKKNTLIALCLGICFGLSFVTFYAMPAPASAASQGKPVELKFGYFTPPQAYVAKRGIVPWGKMIEEATHGKVKIIHYPAQSLFKAPEAIAAVHSGVADIIHTPLGYFTGRFNLTEVMFLPFLLKSPLAEVNSQIIQELYETTPEIQKEYSGMKLLFIFSFDPYFIATIKKPVRNMNDLKGMKIRTIGKYPTRVMKRLGATPVMVPLPGTYEAAAKGVVDGGLLMQPMLPSFKLYEVFNYWTDVVLWPSLVIHAMNLDRWNSLPPDVQQGIMSVSGVKGARFVAREGCGPGLREFNQTLVKKLGEKWVRVELDKGELENWKKIVGQPIWDEWVKEMEKKGLPGQKVLDKTLRLVEKYK